MKRPQGFDPEPESQVKQKARTVRVPRAAAGSSEARRARPTRQPASVESVAPEKAWRPAKAAAPSSSLRPSKRALRASARERRRVERSEVRRFTKRSRTRRAVWLTIAGTVVAMATLLAVAVFSPLLSFEKLEIRGAVGVDESAVRAIVEDQLGSPLALLDHDAIRAGLAGIPLIRSFTTEVTPPNTLTIHLVEREPIGALRTESGFAIVDAAGVVLSRVSERPEGFPRINVDSERASGVGFAAAVEVLLALPVELRANVDTATATTRDDVRLTLRGGGESVVWGSADRSELKARVLAQLLAARPSGSALEFDVSAPLSPVVRSR